MLTRFRLFWDELRASLWFLPGLLVALGMAVAIAALQIDSMLPREWPVGRGVLWRIVAVDSGGAAAMLEVIAGSIITVTGVVFSIAMLAFAQAGTQYTSRVLRSFMRNRANQAVLGVFLGIFVYCLLVLRAVADNAPDAPAPQLSTLLGLALAIVAIFVLVYFIHHVTTSLQAARIVATIAGETLASVEEMFPEEPDERPERQPEPGAGPRELEIRSRDHGYVRGIARSPLVSIAEDVDGVVEVLRGVGEFIIAGEVLAIVRAPRDPDEGIADEVLDAIPVGTQRTVAGDPYYGVRQLVDVALKALSPGVNETTTAVMCVNWLAAVLGCAADRFDPEPTTSSDGTCRLLRPVPSFQGLLQRAFDQIRQSANGNVAVLTRQMQVLEVLAGRREGEADREAIAAQAEAVLQVARETVSFADNRSGIERDAARLLGMLRR